MAAPIPNPISNPKAGAPARAPLPGRPTPRRSSIGVRALTLALAAAVVVADQTSKAWVLTHLAPGQLRPWWPGLLALQRVSNRGAAFSLFSGSIQWLTLVSLLVSAAVLLWILWRPPQSAWIRLALGFLLGGAVGNGIDRLRHGAVTDFLATQPFSFPVFNLADVAINVAVACFLIDQLLLAGRASEGATGSARRHPNDRGHG